MTVMTVYPIEKVTSISSKASKIFPFLQTFCVTKNVKTISIPNQSKTTKEQ